MTNKLQVLEKHIKTYNRDLQMQTEEFKGEPTLPLHYELKKELSKFIKKSALIYPVTIQEQLSNDKYHQGYGRAHWIPVEMLYLRRFKEVIISYGTYLPFGKQMLNSWTISNRIMPQD